MVMHDFLLRVLQSLSRDAFRGIPCGRVDNVCRARNRRKGRSLQRRWLGEDD